MASEVCNVSGGKINAYADNVNDNTPANAVLVLALFVGAGATDNDYRDADSLSAIEALSTAEVTDVSYSRIILSDLDVAASTVDDVGDTRSFDIADQTWVALDGSDSITKLVVGYDSDSAAGTDADIVPCAHYDFVVSTNGSDVTAQINAGGLWSAGQP